ncbi:MAG TPA: sigma 54 modulation/S30EA ribosomal C-terminal domain-containing protein [Solirubrobacteraceae bacterium]
MIDVELTVIASIPRQQVDHARRCIASLDRFVARPLVGARLTLRRDGGSAAHPLFAADADVLFDGRVLAAHATGPTAAHAAGLVASALMRQIRRMVGARVALRNELRELPVAPARRLAKPPEERDIVQRRTYADRPEATLTAMADLLEDAELFHLFVHARTSEDVVVHWPDDGRLCLLHPRGSVLADEGDLLVVQASRYSAPLPFADARAEMDFLNHRFLYFVDAADRRGRVMYLRADGDYGVVEPAP